MPFKQAMINHEVAIQSRLVDLPHQDPADRFLAATAMVYDLILVTADLRLLSSKQFSVLPGIVINESPKKIATDQTSHEGTTRQAHTDSHGRKG